MIASPHRRWRSAVLVLAGCNDGKEPTYQGWIEAELIFVGPDEAGRVETLSVREGDQVDAEAPLFTLDADLQLADVPCRRPRSRTRNRPMTARRRCSRPRPARRRRLDDAEAALRTAQARLNSAQTRLARRKMFSPVAGLGPADLFPARRNGAGRQAGRRAPAARQSQGAVLRQRSDAAADQDRRYR